MSIKSGLHRLFVTAIPLIYVIVGQPNSSWAEAIKNIVITGQFTKGGINWSGMGTLPIGEQNEITFTQTGVMAPMSQAIVFDLEFIRTDIEPNGLLSDIVNITVGAFFFIGSPAILTFVATRPFLPVDRVVSTPRGWTLDTMIPPPSGSVSFSTSSIPIFQTSNEPVFTLDYSYPAPEPSSLALLAVGFGGFLAYAGLRRTWSRAAMSTRISGPV